MMDRLQLIFNSPDNLPFRIQNSTEIGRTVPVMKQTSMTTPYSVHAMHFIWNSWQLISRIKPECLITARSSCIYPKCGGLSPDRGWEFFSSKPCPHWLWGPAGLLSNGCLGNLSLGVKWPGRKADHSSPSVPRWRMRWSRPPLPHTSPWRGA
jgi:hypothetical protein